MQRYSELISQIEELKKQAEKVKKEEFSTIVKSIKKHISEYGITAKDLGLSSSETVKTDRKSKGNRKHQKKLTSTRPKVPPKYRDQFGNTWTGRGKQPRWVVSAIASGISLDSLRIR